MRNKAFVLSAIFAVSCGQLNDANELKTEINLSEDNDVMTLGGSLGASGTFEKLEGTQTGLQKLLNGLHVYRNSENQRCHGFLAYEDAPGDEVVVSFYTALHCLEARDPLGRIRSSGFTFLETLIFKDLKSHEEKHVELRSGKEHLFKYPSGEIGDVARFVQKRRVSKRDARRYFLPVCAENVVHTGYLQAVGTRWEDGARVPSWANFEYQGQGKGLPADARELMTEMGIHPSQGRATGVRTRPGDSGSPIILIQPQQGMNALRSVQEYKCLFGVVTCELWSPDCQRNARTKVCGSWGDSLFERTYGPNIVSSTGGWKPAREVRKYEQVGSQQLDKRKKADEDRRKKADEDRRKKADEDKRKKKK